MKKELLSFKYTIYINEFFLIKKILDLGILWKKIWSLLKAYRWLTAYILIRLEFILLVMIYDLPIIVGS